MKIVILLISLPGISFSQGNGSRETGKTGKEGNAIPFDSPITIHLFQASIEDVFKYIESTTEFRFVYDQSILNSNYRINLNNSEATLNEILQDISAQTDLLFKQVNRIVNVRQEFKEPVSRPPRTSMNITGRIADETNIPLPGVSVLIRGTSTGTVTNDAGFFNLSVPNENAVLVFSYVGFATQQIPVTGRSRINLTMMQNISALGEILVTALGIKRETKKLGYSVTGVNTEELMSVRNVNVGNSLIGKVAGLNVQTPPTGPGGSAKIRIRGQSSFGGNNSPLIVINGVPIHNYASGRGNDAGEGFVGEAMSDTGDGLQSINAEDIASMSILKGAAAAALYGFRAKDGAIIITTKNGTGQSGIGISLSSTVQADQALDFTDFQMEYGQGEYGIRPQSVIDARSSGTWSFGERFDGALTPQIDGNEHPYLPFKDRTRAFYRTGLMLMNSVAISSGGEQGSFRLSVAQTNAKSIVPNASFERISINLGVSQKLTQRFSTQINVNYSNEYNKNPPVFSQQDFNVNQTLYTLSNSIDPRWMQNAYKDPVTGNEINPSRFNNRTNPYWAMNERFENRKRDRLIGNVSLRYEINDWLYAQGRIGQDYFSVTHEVNRPTGSAFLPPVASGFNGNYYQDSENFRELNMDYLIGLNKKFGNFSTDLVLGGNSMDQSSSSIFTSVTNFYVRDLYTINNGQIKEPGSSYFKKRVNSVYGILDVGYKEYLFFTLTGRNDWFSTLNPLSNSYLYPSLSSSFVFSQAITSMPNWLDFGKFRAAYAEVGGDTDPYSDKLFYSINNNTLNGIPLGSISGSVSPNPFLRPLKVKETEFGLDLRLLDNRLKLDIAAYHKITQDEILNVDISNASGYGQTKVNVGKLQNRGIETLISFIPTRSENLSWETALNFSYNKSLVLQLANDQQRFDVGTGAFTGIVSHEVGKPLGSLRGVDFRRDDQGNVVLSNGRMLGGNIVTYGSAVPTHIGAWLNTFTYKSFRLFTQIDFKAGHKLISNSNFNWYRHGLHKSTLPGRDGIGVIYPGVTPEGTPNTTAVDPETFYNGVRSFNLATPFVYDASFIRFRTISLSCDLSKLLRGSDAYDVNMNLYVNNLFMIKKQVDNLDPESQFSTSDNLAGLEGHSLPTTRSYGVNFTITL